MHVCVVHLLTPTCALMNLNSARIPSGNTEPALSHSYTGRHYWMWTDRSISATGTVAKWTFKHGI